MAASEVASFGTNVFRIASTSEAETSVSGKTERFLAIGEYKKVPFWNDVVFDRFPLRVCGACGYSYLQHSFPVYDKQFCKR